MSKPLTDTSLKAGDVAAWLEKNPHFLGQYPELARQLVVPGEQGKVTSLAGYQLRHLREKFSALENSLADLCHIATVNEKLMCRVHALNITLLRGSDPTSALRQLVVQLHTHFHVKRMSLLLWSHEWLPPSVEKLNVFYGESSTLPGFTDMRVDNEPVTGRFTAGQRQQLFGRHADEIQSAALIPLDEWGLLALGSIDGDYFQPGMGTLFLQMIAATFTAAFQRIQHDA